METIHIYRIMNIILIIDYKVMRNTMQNTTTFQTFLNFNTILSIVYNLFCMFLCNFTRFIRNFGGDRNASITDLSSNMITGNIAIDIGSSYFSIILSCGDCFCYTTGKSLNIFYNATFDTFGWAFSDA